MSVLGVPWTAISMLAFLIWVPMIATGPAAVLRERRRRVSVSRTGGPLTPRRLERSGRQDRDTPTYGDRPKDATYGAQDPQVVVSLSR